MTTVVFCVLAFITLACFGGFACCSLKEGEKRAATVSASLACLGCGAWVLAAFLPEPVQERILWFVSGGGVLFLILFLLPVGSVDRVRDVASRRFDERDSMFARARLQPGSERYQAYYTLHPEHEAKDRLFRAQPGLLAPGARYADMLLFAVPDASFSLTEIMHALVEGEPAAEKVPLPGRVALTGFVKSLAKYFGALQVGVTELKPEHVYSHIGRGPGEWGAPVEVTHKYAIAFTVEMDDEIMGVAPEAPVVMESAHQYVEVGRVAVQLAQTIRSWGYPARAHMDGNYRVICPLVARDAGLGEIGRMGLLMTPRQGPRVRIAVVTTDLELAPDPEALEASVIDFCTVCGKCAQNCPPRAIAFNGRAEIDGALRWRIDSDLCYRYWMATGTDCGRCMAVCPYAHPDSFFHNIVRWGNRCSGIFRRAAVRLDDLFYGVEPARRKPPAWVGERINGGTPQAG